GPYFTQANDPRITKVGYFLRRTSIDELPQIINVLRGDMSLVGPRPDVPAQRSLYSDADWAQRCSVRPGITGLAQARIRSEGTGEERLALDLLYTRQASVWFDLKIMWWTLARLGGKGGN
ncbi:MAG: sugar transferase, partial [Pseudomonadota bacterium]